MASWLSVFAHVSIGGRISFPCGAAPTGLHRMAHKDGELAVARALSKSLVSCYYTSYTNLQFHFSRALGPHTHVDARTRRSRGLEQNEDERKLDISLGKCWCQFMLRWYSTLRWVYCDNGLCLRTVRQFDVHRHKNEAFRTSIVSEGFQRNLNAHCLSLKCSSAHSHPTLRRRKYSMTVHMHGFLSIFVPRHDRQGFCIISLPSAIFPVWMYIWVSPHLVRPKWRKTFTADTNIGIFVFSVHISDCFSNFSCFACASSNICS